MMETSAATNPVAATPLEEDDDALGSGSRAVSTADLEQALTGLGTSELPPAMVESAVRTVFGRLTMAPTNWHQMAIFSLSSPHEEDAELRRNAPLMCAVSLALVLTQCAVMAAIALGAFIKTCGSNDDCSRGMFCLTDVFADRCAFCSSSPPIVMYTDDGSPSKPYDKPEWPDVYNFTLVAEVCADPASASSSSRARRRQTSWTPRARWSLTGAMAA